MKKRSYRAQKVNEIRWEAMGQRVEGKALVFAVDVAKVEHYVLMDSERIYGLHPVCKVRS